MENVVNFWLDEVGVDGFRIDAAKHLIEEDGKIENTQSTHDWYKGFYEYYKTINPDAYTVGEAFGAGAFIAKTYENQFDHIFNFELASGSLSSASTGTKTPINSAIKFALKDNPNFNFATFLTNHDQERVMSVLDGDIEKAKVAAFLLLTSLGTPFIYYGEEIGMQGRKPDEDIRLPMQWSSEANAGFTTGTPWRAPALDYQQVNVVEQNEDPDSLLNHYRSLIKLRGENPVLSNGEIVLLDTDNPGVYAVLRSSADQKILVVVNLKEAPISNYQLSLNESLLSDGTVTPRSLFGTLKAIPVTITGGKFSGYKPLNGLLPYELYIFEFE
jgi:glycosidase